LEGHELEIATDPNARELCRGLSETKLLDGSGSNRASGLSQAAVRKPAHCETTPGAPLELRGDGPLDRSLAKDNVDRAIRVLVRQVDSVRRRTRANDTERPEASSEKHHKGNTQPSPDSAFPESALRQSDCLGRANTPNHV